MDLKARIAKAKKEIAEAEPVVVPVEIGGELTDIGFRPVSGREWVDLTATNPPRAGSVLDGNVGFNSDAVALAYPLEKITVDDAPVDAETWADLNDALTGPGVKLIAAALWGINQNDPMKRAAELGKARTSAATKKRTSR